jgi:upstream activation factor subunit UAF30
LEQLSRRMVRKQLEAQFQTDLSHYKDMINETILRLIEEQQQGEDEEDEEDEDEDEPEPSDEDDDADEEEEEVKPRARSKPKKAPAAKKKSAPKKRARRSEDDDERKPPSGGGFNMQLALSPELASVVGADRMARPQIVKALWAYIREHNLQDPKNKKTILFDDKLRGVFQRDSVTMFSMNKFVKRHVRKPDDLPAGGWDEIPRDGVSSDEDEAGKAKKKAAAKRKKKPSGGDAEDGEKKKRANPFNTELALSPELASVLGSDRMARPQIVKNLWAYIHEHELQDPNDKRSILLDDNLRRVFQRDSFTMFSMNKYIKRHARKPDDLPAGGWADVPRDGESSGDDSDRGRKKARK